MNLHIKLGLFKPCKQCVIRLLSATVESSQIAGNTSTWTSRTPRTATTSPSAQSMNPSSSISKFYSIEEPIVNRVVAPFIMEHNLREMRLFNDFSLLVRKPALDVIAAINHIADYRNRTDNTSTPTLPSGVPRFVLYGQPGCGISTQLAHIAHFAAVDRKAFIFAFCNAEQWLDRCSDFTPSDNYHQKQHQSTLDGEALDFPSRSAEWLKSFLALNEPLLNKVIQFISIQMSLFSVLFKNDQISSKSSPQSILIFNIDCTSLISSSEM